MSLTMQVPTHNTYQGSTPTTNKTPPDLDNRESSGDNDMHPDKQKITSAAQDHRRKQTTPKGE
jgi:hypothetical protein